MCLLFLSIGGMAHAGGYRQLQFLVIIYLSALETSWIVVGDEPSSSNAQII